MPVPTFEGYKIIVNPMLDPDDVVIMVGTEYMRKIKEADRQGRYLGHGINGIDFSII